MSSDSRAIQELALAVRRLSLAVERQNSGQAGSSSVDEWECLPPSPRGRQDGDQPSAPLPRLELSLDEKISQVLEGDYQALADLLPPVPDHLRVACKCLHGGNYSTVYRADRAWESGFWGRAVLAGKLDKPRASLSLDL